MKDTTPTPKAAPEYFTWLRNGSIVRADEKAPVSTTLAMSDQGITHLPIGTFVDIMDNSKHRIPYNELYPIDMETEGDEPEKAAKGEANTEP